MRVLRGSEDNVEQMTRFLHIRKIVNGALEVLVTVEVRVYRLETKTFGSNKLLWLASKKHDYNRH